MCKNQDFGTLFVKDARDRDAGQDVVVCAISAKIPEMC